VSIYLFVDGAYLDNAYKGLMDVFDVPGALNIRAIAARPFECAADRIFYYHAVDTSNGKDESDDECAARVQALEARLDTSEKAPSASSATNDEGNRSRSMSNWRWTC
jgi:hypothetical protein